MTATTFHWDQEVEIRDRATLASARHISTPTEGMYMPYFQWSAAMCSASVAKGRTCLTWESYAKKRSVTISFLARGWGEYGRKRLQELEEISQEVQKLGGRFLVFIEGTPEEAQALQTDYNLSFDWVADPHLAYVAELGLHQPEHDPADWMTGIESGAWIPAWFVATYYGKIKLAVTDPLFEKTVSPVAVAAAVWQASAYQTTAA